MDSSRSILERVMEDLGLAVDLVVLAFAFVEGCSNLMYSAR